MIKNKYGNDNQEKGAEFLAQSEQDRRIQVIDRQNKRAKRYQSAIA